MHISKNADGTVSVRAENLNTASVEQLLHDLQLVRNEMQPPVPCQLDPTSEMNFPIQTEPAIEVSRSEDGVTLALRHQGLGWCVFVLPLRQAAFLRDALQKRTQGLSVPDIEATHPGGDIPKH